MVRKRVSNPVICLLFLLSATAVAAAARRPHMSAQNLGKQASTEGTQSSLLSKTGLSSQVQVTVADKGVDPESLCLKSTVLSIEDPPNTKGWMTQDDWGAEFRAINHNQHPIIQVGVDGFPCVAHGCCRHSMQIRRTGSDWKVLQGVINDYAEFLKKLLPWSPKTVLEGGGNIGVATVLLAFMYPKAKIVVLEPETENCMLLKNNTKVFNNVVVKCVGLWDRVDARVELQPGGDGEAWGWKLKEVANGGLRTTTVQALLDEDKLPGFDLVKLDIEGAEFHVFGDRAELGWLNQTQLLSLELHRYLGNVTQVSEGLTVRGFKNSAHSEYDVFARDALHRHISNS